MRSTISLLEGRVLRTVAIRGHKRRLRFMISLESDLWLVILQIPLLLRACEQARGNNKHTEHVVTIERLCRSECTKNKSIAHVARLLLKFDRNTYSMIPHQEMSAQQVASYIRLQRQFRPRQTTKGVLFFPTTVREGVLFFCLINFWLNDSNFMYL